MTTSTSNSGSSILFHALCEKGWTSITLLALLATLTACRKHDFPEYPDNYHEFAYVSNGASNTVSIFDLVNLRLERELPVGERPIALATAPTRKAIYVVNQLSNTITVLSASKNQITATIPVQKRPSAITLTSDDKFAFVANSASNSISLISLDKNAVLQTVGTGEEPVSLALSPDGKTLAVANSTAGSLGLYSLANGALDKSPRAIFPNCPGASNLAILPNSSKVFVACSTGHQVMSVALAAGSKPDRLEAFLDVGKSPSYLALKPDGGEIFVMNSASDTISELVTTTNDIGGAYIMGDHPKQGLATRDNSALYVSNGGSNQVTVYGIDDGKRVGGVQVGDGPSAMAFSTAGHLLLVVDSRSSDLALVRTASQSLFNILPTGREPNSVVVLSYFEK